VNAIWLPQKSDLAVLSSKKSHVAEGVSVFSSWGGNMGKALTIGLVCLTLAVATLAQVTTGRIEGTVTDPQGGVVPGAQIKIVNKLTGQAFESITNETGFWVLPSMPTATYTITVSLAGFKSVTIDNVKVDAGVPAIAVMGDTNFYHSEMSGVMDNAIARREVLHVLVVNRKSEMTAGVRTPYLGDAALEQMLRGMGVLVMPDLEAAAREKGPRIVIFRLESDVTADA